MGGRGRGNVKVYIDGDPSGLGRAVKQSETYLGRLGSGVTRAGDKMVAAGSAMNRGVTLPVLAIGAVAGKTAVDFDKSMRNVNSIAQLPEKGLHRLEKRVLSLAGPTAQAPRTLAEGLYDLVSSGFDANESMVVLDKSARAATAGLTTTEVSTGAVAAVLNSYHLKAGQAGRTSDQLFETVNRGVISFEDLATNIGDVLPFASSLHVGLGQVGASISTMTKEGISAPETMTRIKNVMVTLLKPGAALKKVLKEVGMSGEELVRKRGFQGALEEIISRTNGSKEAVSELFPNIRALGGVLALTGGNARSANQDLSAFRDTAGATNKALSQQKKSLSYEWGQFRAELEETAIKAAPPFLDAAKEIVGEVGDIVEGFDELSPATKKMIINVALLGAAMGPVLTIGGNLLRLLGGTIRIADRAAGAFRTIGTGAAAASGSAGSAAAGRTSSGRFSGVQASFGTYDLARSIGRGRAASTVAQAGATASAGLTAAKGFVGSFATGLAPAIAAIGIGKIITSAATGDVKGAGFELGGALAGGIAGAFLGGPVGAAIGAGLGTFLGDAVGGLFDSGSDVSRMQERLAASAAGVTYAYKKQQEASRGLEQADAGVTRAHRRHRNATEQVEHAEQALSRIRRKSGPDSQPAIRAEVELAKAKRQVTQAVRSERNAERLHGQELRATKELMRIAVLEERHRINVLKDERHAIVEKRKAMKAEGASLQALRPINERLLDNSKKLRSAGAKYSQTLLDASRQAGPKYAKFLREASRSTVDLGRSWHITLKDITAPIAGSLSRTKTFGRETTKTVGEVQHSYEKTKGVLGPFRSETSRQLGRATGDVRSFAAGTKGGFKEVETSLTTALTGLGVKSVSFTTSGPERKARGGVARVPGSGREDNVGLMVNGALSAMVAPGEDLIVANRHQRPELDYAVANTYGDRGLDGFFQRSTRPHYLAKGGIPKPSLSGPDPLQDLGQAAINRVWKAAKRYLSKVGGDQTLRALIKEGNRMDALHQPYLWGGGHGAMPSKSGPWDCSGGISQLFYGAGWKDLRPMVSSGFESFGAPGSGQASIYANAEHVYAVLGGRAIGTSGENPGGGFGWINGYTSRPGFVVRHVDLAGEGAPTKRRTGRGQHLKKGMAKGGVAKGSRFSPFEEKVHRVAGRAWNRAARLYGHSGTDPMPMLYIADGLHARNGHIGEVRNSKGRYGRMVYLDRKWAGRLANGADYSEGALLHEWTHVFQDQGMKPWEREGGATEFQRYASPIVFGNPPGPYPGGYRRFAERVRRDKGDRWIRRGQLRRMAGGGVITGSATWFEGGATAGGSNTSRPGLALNLDPSNEPGGWNNDTTQGWMEASRDGKPVYAQVTIGGKSANLPITDLGPASWTGHSIDVTAGGVRKLGFTTDTFPSGTVGKAVILGEGGQKKDPDQVPVHGRRKLSYEEKITKADTRLSKAETTATKKDDRRAAVHKLDLMRGRKKYVEGKVSEINKKLKGKLKPAQREKLLQQREGFLGELSSIPGEASSLVDVLREAGVGASDLRKYSHGFGIGIYGSGERPTARDRADLQLARAESTPGKGDDYAALERLVKISEKELKKAEKSGDPRKIAEAVRGLKDAAEALREAQPTAQDYANRDLALAELTESTDDDRAALEALKVLAEQQLSAALATADPRDDIEAAQNLKGVTEALKSLESTLSEFEEQRREFEKERLETDKRLANLAETQGPAVLASLLAWVEGAIGGPLQVRSRLATAGSPADFQ